MAPASENEAEHRARQLLAQAHRLYERFGRPLEREHPGEFVAITPDGRTLLGASAQVVGRRAKEAFGPGNFVFRIGSRAVGRWR